MDTISLAHRASRLLEATEGPVSDPTTGLFLYRETGPTSFEASVYDPVACLILQGEKEGTIGSHRFVAPAGHCIVVSHDLPVLARITKATVELPYLAIVIKLDLAVLRSLYDEVGDRPVTSDAVPCSMQVAPVDRKTVDVVDRYLGLLDDPAECGVLLPLVRKELHFRLYMSASGAMLRSLLHRDGHASNIGRAIQMLRTSFRESINVSELARSVGMSASSFHKHFKSVTMTTPLQYQKDLRLTEARRLLFTGRCSVSTAAFEVGYESPSQFSREYARKFGRPPSGELATAPRRHVATP